MLRLQILGLVVLLGVLGAGCGSAAGDNDAIRGAINTHLAARGNLNTSAFDTEIQKVDVQGDEAKADVAFRIKGGPGVMQLTYNLKKTSGAWAVVESNPIGNSSTHPGLDPSGAPASAATPGAPPSVMDAIRQKMTAPAK